MRTYALSMFVCLPLACASPAGDDDGGLGDSEPTAEDGTSSSSSGVTTASSDGDGSGPPSTDADGGSDSNSDSDTSGDGDTGVTPGGAGCPDSLPAEWIFCEDFETLVDPATRFFEYTSPDGRLQLVETDAASGTKAMEATFVPGVASTGWLSVAFGRNPIVYGGNPHYATDQDFTEVYWRLKMRMEEGWPDVGPHKVSRATSFAYGDWGQAMIAHLWSQGVNLMADPAACVTGSTVNCHMYNDFNFLQWLGQMPGTTPLFSEAQSGQWRCIEGHVRLNNPGAQDGVFEFWIDGNLEASRTDLDWRGSWTDYGINVVYFENYWNGGPPVELRRWMDDFVIATVPIGCD